MITRHRRAAATVIGVAGVLYTIPSLALFGMLIPFIGIGLKPTLIALILYSQLALVRNTFVGIVNIDPSIREAGKGIGVSNWQFLRMVELPVALPVIMAGVRTAAVMNIGTATIAAYIGTGGLSWLILRGIASVNSEQIIAENQVDVISGFATDGRIPTFNLVVIEDNMRFFPPYFAAPVVRTELLAKAPKMADVLNQLAGKISDDTMAALNYAVDGKKQDAEMVAKKFLKGQGLIK